MNLFRKPTLGTLIASSPQSATQSSPKKETISHGDAISDLRAFVGGRQTVDDAKDPLFAKYTTIESPTLPDETWRVIQLDTDLINKYPVSTLVDFVVDASPEVSKALSDFIRFSTWGVDFRVFQAGTSTLDDDGEPIGTPHPDGDAALSAFFDVLESYDNGGINLVLSRLFFSLFARGAVLLELVVGKDGMRPVDLVTPDPMSARFRKVPDEERGMIWGLHQWQGGELVRLDRETVQYIPIDPYPEKPFGRSYVTPALFHALFLLGFMYDLRRVVQQQGYPRHDISFDAEKLFGMMPPEARANPVKQSEYIKNVIKEVETYYAKLKPDAAFFHLDTMTLNRPAGTLNTASLGAMDDIIKTITRQITRALKSTSLTMGSNDSRSETQVKQELITYGLLVESGRAVIARALSRLLTLSLECQGINAEVVTTFGKLTNLQAQANDPDPDSVDMATDRSARIRPTIPHKRVAITPDGSEDPLIPQPAVIAVTLSDLTNATGLWNVVMTEIYRHLLNAAVENQTFFDDTIDAVIVGSWVWRQLRKGYRNRESGRVVENQSLTRLRDEFTTSIFATADDLTDRLADGKITIQQWQLEFRRSLKDTYTAQYLLGKGGRNNLTQSDLETIADMVSTQYGFFDRFAGEVQAGRLSQDQIKNRSRLYFESATHAFERGKTDAFSIILPAHPADGSQDCLSRCKCEWRIEETETEYRATWTLNPSAEHCQTCQTNATQWNPYVIEKTETDRSIDELMVHLSTLERSQHADNGKPSRP